MLTHQRSSNLRLLALAFALLAGLTIALGAMLSAAQAAPVGKLTQFKVPTDNSQPRHIAVGSDGNLWFTEGNEIFTPNPDDPDAGAYRNIGRITPAGEITEFRIDSRDPENPLPTQCDCLLNDIVQGPGGVLYFTTNNPGLGRITTAGKILPFVAPNNTSANGAGIAAHGTDVWYADFNNDSLWRYDTTSGIFTQFPVPEPSDVAVDEDGIVWFTVPLEQGDRQARPGDRQRDAHADLPRAAGDHRRRRRGRLVQRTLRPPGVGELDPDTNDVREFQLNDNPGPQDIAASPEPNGPVWFTQTTKGNIARITDDGVITEGKVVKNSEPFGITVRPNGANGDPWYAMLEANKIARLTSN